MVAIYAVWYNLLRIHKSAARHACDGRWPIRYGHGLGADRGGDGCGRAKAGPARSLQKTRFKRRLEILSTGKT